MFGEGSGVGTSGSEFRAARYTFWGEIRRDSGVYRKDVLYLAFIYVMHVLQSYIYSVRGGPCRHPKLPTQQELIMHQREYQDTNVFIFIHSVFITAVLDLSDVPYQL